MQSKKTSGVKILYITHIRYEKSGTILALDVLHPLEAQAFKPIL